MHRFKSHLIELDGHFVIVELKFTWPRKKNNTTEKLKTKRKSLAQPINQVAFAGSRKSQVVSVSLKLII